MFVIVILEALDLSNQVFRLFQLFYSRLVRTLTQFKQFIFHREKYSKYDDHFRYEVAVWAEKHGQRQAGKKYAIPESIVRSFLKSDRAQKSLAVKTRALKQGKRGKRTMVPAEIDEKVLEMIRNMCNAGVVINFHTVVGLATGVVLTNYRTLLKENGGTVKFTVGWCLSIFKKFTNPKPLIAPGLIKEIGIFYKEIHELVKWFNIPKELVINIDQIQLPFVLVSSYTMENRCNQCVPVAGITDYRQITGTFSVSLSGGFLPVQLIYQGKTNRCQLTYPFPREFHVTQTKNHWANENTSLDLIKEVLVPYIRKFRQKLSLPEDQQRLLIADVFKGNWTDAVVTEAKRSNGKMCAIPSNMTNIFQPLDLSVTRNCKSFLRREAQSWYYLQIEKQMKDKHYETITCNMGCFILWLYDKS